MKKILVVDDQKDILEMMKLVIEKTGKYTVFATANPLEVEPLCTAHRPDVLVLDLVMPEMEGPQLLEILRQDKKSAKMKIIITSGLGEFNFYKKKGQWDWEPNSPLVEHRGKEIIKEPSPERAAENYGVDDYIAKPFSPEKLLEVIEDVLTRDSRPSGDEPDIVID